MIKFDGIVYALWTKQEPKGYIGSSLHTAGMRLQMHKDAYIRFTKTGKPKYRANLLLKHGDCVLDVLERYEIEAQDSKDAHEQLIQYEQYWMDMYKDEIVNGRRADHGRDAQRRDASHKKSVAKNREAINARWREYYRTNQEYRKRKLEAEKARYKKRRLNE
jgi:hypothetical protein